MWAAFTQDIQELVSTVAEDTSQVLSKVDEKLQIDLEDDSTTDTNSERNDNFDSSEIIVDEDGNLIESGFDESKDISPARDEVIRLQNLNETFLDPLPDTDEANIFLSEFTIDKHTEEISSLLEKYPNSLQLRFTELVPVHIKYEEFWMRYFFRCDEEKIEMAWEEERIQLAQAREERAKALMQNAKEGLSGVRNFVSSMGNMVAPVSNEGDYGLTEQPKRTDSNNGVGFMSMMTGTGRPPFVIPPTDGENDDDESDEELGWDESDDEDDDDNDINESSESLAESEIVFSADDSEAKEVLEERNLLRETVETQKKEIGSLQLRIASHDQEETGKDPHDSLNNPGEVQNLISEVKSLNELLIRAESEKNAALEKVSSIQEKVEELQQELDKARDGSHTSRDESCSMSSGVKIQESDQSHNETVLSLETDQTVLSLETEQTVLSLETDLVKASESKVLEAQPNGEDDDDWGDAWGEDPDV